MKSWEQMIMERQASECGSMEELFVLWQLMQQMEAPQNGEICYPEIDPRTFHLDGRLSEEGYGGIVYLLREPDMREYIRRGSGLPVIADARRQIMDRKARWEPSIKHVIGMQRILNGEDGQKMSQQELLSQCAVVYVNKRGGKGSSDGLYYRYGQFYTEFLRQQLRLLKPKLMICCGEDIFKLAVKEIGDSKKQIRNKGEYTVWKDVVHQWKCFADEQLHPLRDGSEGPVTFLHMWDPSYRVNKDTYVSLEEYLREFEKRMGTEETQKEQKSENES